MSFTRGNDLTLAMRLADAADSITLARYQSIDLVVSTKPDNTPVTDADKAAEEAIRALLKNHRPEDGIVGEEFGNDAGGAERDRPGARTAGLALAVSRNVGLGGGRGVLRHVFALLLRPRDATCRSHGGGADGLPARAADRSGGLGGVCRAGGPVHCTGRRADLGREPAEPAARTRGALIYPSPDSRRGEKVAISCPSVFASATGTSPPRARCHRERS